MGFRNSAVSVLMAASYTRLDVVVTLLIAPAVIGKASRKLVGPVGEVYPGDGD
jgi:hypothetical protein